MTMPFFVIYLHRVRGIDLTVAAFALAMVAVASFPGNVIGGSLAVLAVEAVEEQLATRTHAASL